MTHDFDKYLDWSKGSLGPEDRATIAAMVPGCISVEPSSELLDKAGVDWVATLRRGAQVLIDCKSRRPGCSRYWRQGPELALETWSVCPGGKFGIEKSKSKVGWTLCERKTVDLILFKFDPSDCRDVFLVCFQLLRIAFRNHHADWTGRFKVDTQDNGRFESRAVFVPADVVLQAIDLASRGKLMTESIL